MDWFGFGRRANNVPSTTPLEQQRTKQVEALKQHNPGIRELHRNHDYRLNIVCSNGLSITLHLNLPPKFPQDKPRVTVTPPSRHPWVEPASMTITGCSSLNNFTVHSDLGRIIREIADEFQARPPSPNPAPSASSNSVPYLNGFASSSSAGATNPSHPSMAATAFGTTLVPSSHRSPSHFPMGPYQPPNQPTYQPPVPPHRPPQYHPIGFMNENHFSNHSPSPPPNLLPPLPSVIPSLRDKSMAQLKELSTDEGLLYEAIMELPDIKCLETNRLQIMQQTEELAKRNLDLKPRLAETKEQLRSKHNELETLKGSVDGKLQIQSEKNEGRSIPHLQDKLKISVMEADEESETIADSFLDGKLPLDQFLKNYKSKRKTSYMLKASEEKLGHMIYTGQAGDL